MTRWAGEPFVLRAFGPEGFKALCLLLLDEINILRAEAGLPARTFKQLLTVVNNKITENAADMSEG